MRKRILQFRMAAKVLMIGLLLSLVGTINAFAQNFTDGDLNYSVITGAYAYTVKVTGHVNGVSATGSVSIPRVAVYNNRTYTVKTIGRYAFNNCSGITSITISNSVTSIEDGAFNGCSAIEMITIPNSVTTLGNEVISGCTGLESITVASGNTTFDSRNNCNAIIKTSSNELLYGCKNTIIPSSVTAIGNYAFSNCSGLVSIIIPNSVTSIGNYAFSDCSGLSCIDIPNTITSIGYCTFRGCIGLSSIIIPNSISSIASYAFSGCTSLLSVNIPSSVTTIGTNPFSGCSGLEQITVDSDNSIFDCRESCNSIIESATNKLIAGCKNSIIPNSITAIGVSAFSGCNQLTGTIVIPISVTTIGGSAFRDCIGLTGDLVIADNVTSIGNYAFSGCSGFDGSLTIGTSITYIGGNAFSDTGFTSLHFNATNCSVMGYYWDEDFEDYTGSHVFNNCSSLTSLQIGENVQQIPPYAFEGISSLSGTLYIPNSVTSLGEHAFADCTGFTGTLNIPENITVISKRVFFGCVGFDGNLTMGNQVIRIGEDAFWNCSGFVGGLSIPNSVKTIGDYAFYGCSGFNSILTIPSSVTFIGEGAFNNCSGLTEIRFYASNCSGKREGCTVFQGCTAILVIGNNVSNIPNYLFCSGGFTGNLIIPESVTRIGEGAFSACYQFNGSLKIPNSVTSIGNWAFSGCSSFSDTLTIGTSVQTMGYLAFASCGFSEIHYNAIHCSDIIPIYNYLGHRPPFESCNAELIIGEGVTRIPSNMFRDQYGGVIIGDVIIPSSVSTIGDYAFAGNGYLTSLTILAETPPSIQTSSFSNVPKSIPVYVPCGSAETYQSAAYWNEFTTIQEVCSQQTVTLSQGWNWFSTYIEGNPVELLAILEESLGEHGILIESLSDGVNENLGDSLWMGNLDGVGMTTEQMYMIEVDADCTVELQGTPANPAYHAITINPGWNWIGFPCSEEVNLAVALSGFEAEEGDMIESLEGGVAEYQGDGLWMGFETMVPGRGYMYYSNSTVPKTLIFRTEMR